MEIAVEEMVLVCPFLSVTKQDLSDERRPFRPFGKSTSLVFSYSQEELEDKNDFVTEWRGVKLFLEQLPKPTCLIAHNGLKFDFRLLYVEFERNCLLESNPLPDQVYFIDSYRMFIDLEKKLHDELRTAVRLLDWGRLSSQIQTASQEVSSSSQPELNITSDSLAAVQAKNGTATQWKTEVLDAQQSQCSVLDTTSEPKRPTKRQFFAGDHPLNFIRTKQWSPAKKKRVQPNLFKRSSEGDWVFNNQFSVKYFREKGAFRLESMHEQLLDCTFNTHFAEDDCMALLKVCVAYGNEFVEYVDAHAAMFPN